MQTLPKFYQLKLNQLTLNFKLLISQTYVYLNGYLINLWNINHIIIHRDTQ